MNDHSQLEQIDENNFLTRLLTDDVQRKPLPKFHCSEPPPIDNSRYNAIRQLDAMQNLGTFNILNTASNIQNSNSITMKPMTVTNSITMKPKTATKSLLEDPFPTFNLLVNKECRIYPKNASYCVIRFGPDFKSSALALPHITHHDKTRVNELQSLAAIDWGTKAYFNCKRIHQEFNGIKWLATLVWTGCRKPMRGPYTKDSDWEKLLEHYNELGFDLDTTLEKLTNITMKSIANGLNECFVSPSGDEPVTTTEGVTTKHQQMIESSVLSSETVSRFQAIQLRVGSTNVLEEIEF